VKWDIHSSGKSIGYRRRVNIYLDFGIPGEEVMYISHRKNRASGPVGY
jgi:hypothetical protein